MSLQERLERKLARVSLTQHRLARLRADLEAAVRRLRVGEAEAVVQATLDAKRIVR